MELVLSPTSLVGPGAPPPPPVVTTEAQWFFGASNLQFDTGGGGWNGFMFWTGALWRFVCNIGPLAPWNPVNQPLTWNAGTERFDGIGYTTNCGPGFSWVLTFDVSWQPRMYAGEQVLRADLDELDGAGEKWSWFEAPGDLPGAAYKRTHLGGYLWLPNHTRGLTRKFGSSSLPEVLDPWVEWVF